MVVELTVTTSANAGAGFALQVVQAGANLKSEETQKIVIPIKFLTDLDKARNNAEIAEANRRERNAAATVSFARV